MIPTRTAPPRFVVRTMIATFATVALVLSAVFVVIAINVRDYTRGMVAEKLEAGQRMLSALEQRRARELQAQVATLAESPTLKAATDTYHVELANADTTDRRELLETIDRELEKLAVRIRPDVLAVINPAGEVIAAAGRRQAEWPRNARIVTHRGGSGEEFASLPSGVFRVASAPLAFQDTILGSLQLGTGLGQEYARELSVLSGASTLIVSGDRIIATTLPSNAAAELTPSVLRALPSADVVPLAGSDYAIRLLFQEGEAATYALDSIDASAGTAVAGAVREILMIALAAFGVAGFASLWLARSLARPIHTLSRSVADMTRSRDFDEPIAPTGFSLEVDALTDTFNTMMRSVAAAEAETRSAYVGAIRALALALDARDPYTAGHSERVSAISVTIGRQMALEDDQLDVLRLGALLHDIGKIGISDDVLRKPSSLTPDEYELIKQHPTLGARILRSVPFLAPHIPIVELHHERPDGKGYPHGLSSDQTPLLARIVHAADAFDAITSARAYRRGRGSAEALGELWRHAGTQFDAEVVQALARALPLITAHGGPGTADSVNVDTATIMAPKRISLIRG